LFSDGLDYTLTIALVPSGRELFVKLFGFWLGEDVEGWGGMAGDEAEEDSSCPFFGMEVIELDSASILELLYFWLELLISCSSDRDNKIHPLTDDGSEFVRDLEMDRFPDDFSDQIDNLLIIIFLNELF
jgi:hypothetical protein